MGKNPAESWELFRVPIDVNAQTLTTPDLWVTTNIGLTDTFALNLPGVLNAQVGEPGFTLLCATERRRGRNTRPRARSALTPTETGTMRGIIAVSGYDLYTEDFPVIEAYGTLSGHVDANGSPAVGRRREGIRRRRDISPSRPPPTRRVTTRWPTPILCATYTVKVDYFGYLHWEQPFFVNYGANVLNINLVPAPSGVIAGTVLEDETDLPLQATIKIYRSDTMELYSQTTSSATDGSYTTPTLPYFSYVVNVKAWHHIP